MTLYNRKVNVNLKNCKFEAFAMDPTNEYPDFLKVIQAYKDKKVFMDEAIEPPAKRYKFVRTYDHIYIPLRDGGLAVITYPIPFLQDVKWWLSRLFR